MPGATWMTADEVNAEKEQCGAHLPGESHLRKAARVDFNLWGCRCQKVTNAIPICAPAGPSRQGYATRPALTGFLGSLGRRYRCHGLRPRRCCSFPRLHLHPCCPNNLMSGLVIA
eukprot:61388-Rhodomonas_salina.1